MCADRYWVGGSGNWSDNTNHWSDTSGGSPGASKPTSADNVYFNANSFTEAGQTVTIDEVANCLDMDWTGALYNPTLVRSNRIELYGNLTCINEMGWTYAGEVWVRATSQIVSSGKQIATLIMIGTTCSLLDDLTCGYLRLRSGTFNTNNHNIDIITLGITLSDASSKTLNLGSSVVTAMGDIFDGSGTNLSLNSGTSTIIMTGNNKTFAGRGLTYNNVEFQGTPTTVTGDNTFNTLTVDSGKTCKLTAGTTQTITDLSANGAILQSATPGSAATLSCASGTITVKNATITDIVAEGGATFNAVDCVVDGVSDGWNIIKTGGFMTCRSKFW